MSEQYRDANAKWNDRFADHLLKESAQTGDDENKPTTGETQLYPDPESQEQDPTGKVLHSDAAERGAQRTQHGVVERALASKLTSANADKALMAQNFKHVASGNYDAHALALQNKKKEAQLNEGTLLERVRRTFGRD